MSGLASETVAPRSARARLRYGSLCTGIGGLDLAVGAHFGATAAWHSEVEPAPCQVLERHWPGVPNLGDLTAVDWSQVEPVDIITAGYPCQPFSYAGERKGSKDARHLWPYIIEAVRHLRPRWVVAENVRGHLSLGFDEVLWSLAEAGFDAEWCLLRASDVGACHQRARLFIVAADADGGGLQERRQPDGRQDEPGLEAPCRNDPDRLGAAAPDADRSTGRRHGAWGGPSAVSGSEVDERAPVESGRCDRGDQSEEPLVTWGAFGPAITRHARVLGRPAPAPTDDAGRLSPRFVEWMQMYPEGWVDGLTRTQALKALGNAVVPQQGLAALRELAPELSLIGAVA